MSTFTVITECGTSSDFDTVRDAQSGRETHRMLCDECGEGDVHIEAAAEQSTLDADATRRDGADAQEAAVAAGETPPGPAPEPTSGPESASEPPAGPKSASEPGSASGPESAREPEPAIEPADGGRGAAALPDSMPGSVRTDPLDVVPEYMIDEVEGQPTINKRGYAVIAHHFDIVVSAEPITTAGETDHEYAEFRARAWKRGDDPEQAYTGHATARASEDRRGMADNLNEMAETRAMKRAVAWASGVGILAWEEMAGYLEEREA